MGYRILVVDNQPMMLEFMQALLEKAGHDVRAAQEGLEAIKIAKNFKPEIMFVDMVMPYIDGIRLCGILRKIKELENSLYVIISGVAAEAGSSFFSSLADVYIAKGPFIQITRHIMDVLEKHSEGKIDDLKNRILGVDEIYHREVTKELLFSHKHLEVMFSSMEYAVVEFLKDFRIVYVNKAAEKILGKPEEDLLSKDFRELLDSEFHQTVNNFVKSMDLDGLELGDEKVLRINDRYVHMQLMPVIEEPNKSIMTIIRDTTKYKIAQREIQRSLETKELLLKEINHRIKNNLGLIGSLINLQKSYIDNPQYSFYLDEIKGKIQSIELIHEKLYKTADFKNVDIGSYLYDLAVMIIKTVTDSSYGVEIRTKGGNFSIPIKSAIPLGLITAEVITNAVKYGFGDIKNNEYLNGDVPVITLCIHSGERYGLSIENNGAPLADDLDVENPESLGLILIHDLAQQLRAEYSLEPSKDRGTVFSISFPVVNQDI